MIDNEKRRDRHWRSLLLLLDTTTDDPIKGTWAFRQVSDTACGMAHLAYGDGLWVGVGQACSSSSFGAAYPLAFVAADPLGDWALSAYTTQTGTAYYPKKVLYGGGKWVIQTNKVIYVSSDPRTGVWTEVTPGVSSAIADVIYHEGQWVILDTIKTGYAYVADDPAGTWTKVTLTLDTTTSATFSHLAAADGKWFANNSGALYQATDLAGTWTKLGTVSSYSSLLAYDCGLYAVSYDTDADTSAPSIRHYHGYHVTPTIATEGAYTYIKAKE